MKKVLTIFFVTLGVIFFMLLLAGLYFYITDPLNLKPLLFGTDAVSEQGITDSDDQQTPVESAQSVTKTGDSHPLMNDAQEQALETFGIDPASLPSQITPAQEACFTEILGAERVTEIKAGASPTATEFFKARSCL